MAITILARNIAGGIIFLASRISPVITEALSTPLKANAIVDQKMASLRWLPGISAVALMSVAEPKRNHARGASMTRRQAGAQELTAPRLCSQRLMSRPAIF